MSLSAQRAVLQTLLEPLNAWDLKAVADLLSDSPEFLYASRPGSIAPFMGPPKTKVEILEALAQNQHILNTFGLQPPMDIVQEQDKLFAWLKSDGKMASGDPFLNEYVFMIHYEPGTAKILKIIEFVDSLYMSNLLSQVPKPAS